MLNTKTMDFLYKNKENLHQMTRVFQEYYPNVFRILAWSPLQFKKNVMCLIFMKIFKFLDLMGYFITNDINYKNSTDLFHFILDLPLMAALLEYMDKFWDHCNGDLVSIFDVKNEK